MMSLLISLMEKGHLPDSAVRYGIRNLLGQRLNELQKKSLDEEQAYLQSYVDGLKQSPLAVHTREANDQHYELPSEFFLHSLGKHLKYSCGYWEHENTTLDESEFKALDISITRAQIKDGMKILELGCGWGSLTLEMGKRFPSSKIVAISNSSSQKAFIDEEARKRGLSNITVLTRDVSKLETLALEHENFDRVMSIEMFEHFKNYEILLKKISDVLTPQGKVFIHIFTHQKYAYPFETDGDSNWMGRYFFTGGQMPSHNLLYSFQKDLNLDSSWAWHGTHYEKTCNAWLKKMDQNEEMIRAIFVHTYGKEANEWYNRWRVFFMACAELFGYKGGSEWGVSHYLFSQRS